MGRRSCMDQSQIKKVKSTVILIALASLTGCGTIRTLVDDSGETGFARSVYGGARLDAALIHHAHMSDAGMVVMLSIVDMPFSALADTVALPYTVTRALLMSETNKDSKQERGRLRFTRRGRRLIRGSRSTLAPRKRRLAIHINVVHNVYERS